jgi:hypothetical protein
MLWILRKIFACHTSSTWINFRQRFSLNEASSVLYSTTVNFDPSMVELLVAMYAGAELIIPPANWVESDAEKTIRHQPISFFQVRIF